jgi:hypothetical protein
MTEAKAVRIYYMRDYSLFKSGRLNAKINLTLHIALTSSVNNLRPPLPKIS